MELEDHILCSAGCRSACPSLVRSELHISPTLLCSGHKLDQSFIISEDAPLEKRKQKIRICCFPKYIGGVAKLWEALVAGVLLDGKLGVPNQKEVLPVLLFCYPLLIEREKCQSMDGRLKLLGLGLTDEVKVKLELHLQFVSEKADLLLRQPLRPRKA